MSKILRMFYGIKPQFIAVFAVLFVCVFTIVGHQEAYATGPSVINFQGKVVNADGTNVTNGTYNFDFVMYDDAALGTPSDGVHDKWHELTKSVTVTNGVFQTNLGSATALPDFNTNPALYLAVRFNADAAGYMTPRVQMASVPYALNADNLGGITSSGYAQLSPSGQQTGSINISGNITAAGAGNNSFTGSLQSAAYLLGSGPDLSLQPVVGGQSVVTSWWGLQLVGNKQSTVTYAPANIGTAGQYGVIIPAQQAGAVALLLRGASAQTGDLLQVQNSTGTVLVNIDASGSLTANNGLISNGTSSFYGDALFKAANSATAFQIQNSGSLNMLLVDSSALQVHIGSSTTDANAVQLVLDSYNNATDPSGQNGATYYNSSLARFRCYENGGWRDCITREMATRSFLDTVADPVVDANTTSYWDLGAENNNQYPNISPSTTVKSVWGIFTVETQSTGTADVEVTVRIERSIGTIANCGSGLAVGGQAGTFASNTNARKTSTAQFLDSPATTSKVFYRACSDTDTVGTTANITRLRVTLFEIDNSNL